MLGLAWDRFPRPGEAPHLRPEFRGRSARRPTGWPITRCFAALKESMPDRGWGRLAPGVGPQREPATLARAGRELAEVIDRHRFCTVHVRSSDKRSASVCFRPRGCSCSATCPCSWWPIRPTCGVAPHLFALDANRRPRVVCRSTTGPVLGKPVSGWGLPVLRLGRDCNETGYRWWGRAGEGGFSPKWTPSGSITSVGLNRIGSCLRVARRRSSGGGCGDQVRYCSRRFGRHSEGRYRFVAEDLGVITPEGRRAAEDRRATGDGGCSSSVSATQGGGEVPAPTDSCETWSLCTGTPRHGHCPRVVRRARS